MVTSVPSYLEQLIFLHSRGSFSSAGGQETVRKNARPWDEGERFNDF